MDAQLLPAPVADEVLDRLARDINELARRTGLEFHLQLGERVLAALYDGDVGQWRERGTADTSLRKLARRQDLRISKSVLHRSLHVYEVYERLGRPRWTHLGVSHVAEVLKLPDHQQATMLEAAEDYRWTVRELRDQVQPDEPEPPPLPRFVRSALRLKKVLASTSGLDDLDRVHELDAAQREDLQAIATSLRERADAIEQALST